MREATLLKCALVGSLLGIFVLGVLVFYIEPREYSVDLTQISTGDHVKAQGIVRDIDSRPTVTFMELDVLTPRRVVLFDETAFEGVLEVGDRVEVIGRTEEYKGEEELIGERVRKIS